ncbi:MAG: MEDS domain-containing protein [Acidobacteria bacterium]|nr:MEDS domain-containing protein [Acidobacteriota bacterium]
MPPPLFTHLEGGIPMLRHEHVAVLYRGRAIAFHHASFLSEGIERGDVCVYLAPPDYHAEMRAQVRNSISHGDISDMTSRLRTHGGAADFDALRELCQQTFDEAESAGAPAVRWLEDGLWPAAAEFPMPHFFEFHALLNYQVKHYPSAALCQYDLDRFSTQHLFQAIAVHRHLIVEGLLVRDNPFYIPAEKFIPLSAEDREHDLTRLFREVGFEMPKLLAALAAYGRLRGESIPR